MSRPILFLAFASLLAGAGCDTGGPGPDPPSPTPSLDLAWFTGHEEFTSAPPAPTPGAAAGGLVYDGGGKDIQAIDAATGAVRWRARVDDNFVYTGVSLLADDRASYGIHYDVDLNRRNSLRAWSATDGAVLWEVATEDGDDYVLFNLSDIAADDRAVFASLFSRGQPVLVRAYAKASGAVLWTTTLGSGYGGGSISVGDGQAYVIQGGPSGEGRSRTTALDAETGAVLWTYDGVGGVPTSTAIPSGDRVFVTTRGSAATTLALDAATGAEIWAAPGLGEAAAADGEGVYVGDAKGMKAFDRATGAQLWAVSYGEGNTHSRTVLLFGGYAVNPTRAGLMVHDRASGEILAAIPSPDGSDFLNGSVGHGRLYAQTHGGVYAIDGFNLVP